MTETKDQKAERLAAALRANLRRRKGQQRGRDDLSGRDPKRKDTLLQQGVAPNASGRDDTRAETEQESGDASASSPNPRPDLASPVNDDKQA